jgi:hypothetical protein
LVFPTRKLENIDGIFHWYLRKLSMILAIAMNKIVEKYFIGIFILLIIYNTMESLMKYLHLKIKFDH